jgi:hypothetical protein
MTESARRGVGAPGPSRRLHPKDLHVEVEGLADQRMIEIEHNALLADLLHPNATLAPRPFGD